MKPIVSIVIANYNFGRFLDDAIQSVLMQSCKDFELIICDGGSKDNSVDVIQKYAGGLAPNTERTIDQALACGSHITWWCSEKDHGQSAAFNKGFSHAKGRYLTWLNADDVFMPQALTAITEAIRENPDAQWFAGGMAWCDEKMVVKRISIPHVLSSMRIKGRDFTVGGPSSFFTKDLLMSVGGVDETLHYTMDLDLWCRFVFRANTKYIRIPRAIWGFRMHEASKTASPAVNPDDEKSSQRLCARQAEDERRFSIYGKRTFYARLARLSFSYILDAIRSTLLTLKNRGCRVMPRTDCRHECPSIFLSNSFQEYMTGLELIPAKIHVFNTWYRKQFVEKSGLSIVDPSLMHNARRCASYVVDNQIQFLYAQGMRSLLFFRKVKTFCGASNVAILVNCHSPRLWDSFWRSFLFVLCAGLFSNGMIFLVDRTRKKWRWLYKLFGIPGYHVPNPTDIRRFKRKKWQANERIMIGNIGVITQRKRQDVIVECVHQLRAEGYNVYACLAGNTDGGDAYLQAVQALASRLGVAEYISFPGVIPYDEVPGWLEGIDIYVCPSDAEVMPFSILEAMATSLPIIAHDIAGIHEEVHDGDNGFLVRGNQVDDYVRCCKKIIDGRLYEKMGNASRAIVEKDFTMDKYANQMREIFTLLGRNFR